MSIDIKQTHEKEIIALSPFESVRLRPGMYIGQVELMEDKLPLIIDNKIINVEKNWSPGFNHLFVEIFENALDEAKRCKGKMQKVYITINLDNNEITVADTGDGFHNAAKIHKKTNKTVVRTALEELHAGSNFSENSSNILGTHGVGSAVCNMLSEKFYVKTINETDIVEYEWKDYVIVNESIRKKKKELTGTTISFIPSKEVFKKQKYDLEILKSYLSFKKYLISKDPIISNLELDINIITNNILSKLELYTDFIPKESISVETKFGSVFMWSIFDNSAATSFVNGSMCSGIHQKIINDWCNDYFDYNLAHHYFETLIILNVNSKLLKFSDQNKTRYAITRAEIEAELEKNFKKKLISQLSKSKIAEDVKELINNRKYTDSISKIKKSQKNKKHKISEKFIAPSGELKTLYLVEGSSSQGSVSQARNAKTEGIYALRGKVKNAKTLADLAENIEIMDIISILGLELNTKKDTICNKIVIAADSDFDGNHIASLIINFFERWFPHIIENKKLFILATPLVSCKHNNEPKYFYDLNEYEEFIINNKVTSINYLKGLGSLSIDDWKYVMANKVLWQVTKDCYANKFLDIIFGNDSKKKRKWLEN